MDRLVEEACRVRAQWLAAVQRHNDLLASEADVTGTMLRNSGDRCSALYQRLAQLAIEALPEARQ